MSDHHICVPYYSLPEFPQGCQLVEFQDILPRDILLANPRNRVHRKIGTQYDPAVESEMYYVCQPRVRRGVVDRSSRYENIFLLFRTSYIQMDGSSTYLVTGYYRISSELHPENPEDPEVPANEMRFVSINDAVDISGWMRRTRAYRSTPSSENRKWSPKLHDWTQRIKNGTDRTRDYIVLINSLKDAFKRNEFVNERYSECQGCGYITDNRAECPLIHRQNTWDITDLSRYYDSIL